MKQFYIYTQDDKKYRVDLDEYHGDVMQIAVQMLMLKQLILMGNDYENCI